MTICVSRPTRLQRAAPPIRAARPRSSTLPVQLVRFAGVGGMATAVQLGLFAGLLLVMPGVWANLASWAASTLVANTAQRSVTFGVHSAEGARRDLTVSTAFSTLGLAVSWIALAELSTDDPVLSIVVLLSVNCAVGVARFVGLRWWFTAQHA